MKDKILVTRSSMPPFEEYLSEIKDLWESHWLTNMGEKHKQLESQLLDYLDAENIALFSNGHLALESAIAVMDLEREVITTPFTFVSTTHAIVRNGLTPVFCDIEPDSMTIDPGKIENLITEKTSAIIPVHVYGNICDYGAIQNIADKHDLKVIYDAAHAFGVRIDGDSVADLGDASMFSFHATKVFNTIEGGAVTFKDKSLKPKLDQIKNYGITGPETVERIGGNAKMNEFQAAMGICNLRHLKDEVEKRKVVFETYIDILSGINGIKPPQISKSVLSNYAYFPVVFDGYRYSRDEVNEMMKRENIYPRKYFYPLTNSFECYRDSFDQTSTPVAKYMSDRVLTLPIYADLSIEDVKRICSIITN